VAATGFAWMFSGARLPLPRLIDLALIGASWLAPVPRDRAGPPADDAAAPLGPEVRP